MVAAYLARELPEQIQVVTFGSIAEMRAFLEKNVHRVAGVLSDGQIHNETAFNVQDLLIAKGLDGVPFVVLTGDPRNFPCTSFDPPPLGVYVKDEGGVPDAVRKICGAAITFHTSVTKLQRASA